MQTQNNTAFALVNSVSVLSAVLEYEKAGKNAQSYHEVLAISAEQSSFYDELTNFALQNSTFFPEG